MNLNRGQKIKISSVFPGFSAEKPLIVSLDIRMPGKTVLDIACFGLDDDGQLRDDRYFVFYNQKRSPEGAIEVIAPASQDQQRFQVVLSKLPTHVRRLVFTATIDEASDPNLVMRQVVSGHFQLLSDEQELARFDLRSVDYHQEKALIVGEMYFKDEWRIAAVGQGFAGGLKALLTSFGGETSDDATQTLPTAEPKPPVVLQKRVELDKKLQQQAPGLLSLAKKAELSLRKVGLEAHQAQVALCLDISGSMSALYSSGKVQRLAEKALALGTRFDDNGAIDIFLFGEHAHSAGEMSIDNFNNFISGMLRRFPLEGGTNYGKVMQKIRQHYLGSSQKRSQPLPRAQPVYVMFVTDGQPFDREHSRQQMYDSAFEPIFWQFMGLGRSNKSTTGGQKTTARGQPSQSDFGFLESLDEMTGRYLDNADFFSVTDPEAMSDEALYALLTTEYPKWVEQLAVKGLIVEKN
jgi:stress response protein SCP2